LRAQIFFQKGKENFLFWIFAKAKKRKRGYGFDILL